MFLFWDCLNFCWVEFLFGMDVICCDGFVDFCEEFKEFFILEEGCENFSWSSNEFVMIFKEFIFMSVFVIDGVSIILVEGSRVFVVSGSFIWYKRKYGN